MLLLTFCLLLLPFVGVCNCSMFCCTFLYVHSSIAIILMGKRELVVLINLPSWCLVMVKWLFLALSQGCLRFMIVVFSYIFTYKSPCYVSFFDFHELCLAMSA